MSERYKFRNKEATTNRSKATILKCATKILKQHRSRGINIVEICADGEFSHVKNDVLHRIITIAPKSYFPEVEISIYAVKEGVRAS